MRPLLIALIILLLAGYPSLTAQNDGFRMNPDIELGDTTQEHLLVLMDFSKLIGTAMAIEGKKVFFKLHSANTISSFPITEVRYLGIHNGKTTRRGSYRSEGPPFSDFTYLRTALPSEGKGRLRIINIGYSVAEWKVNKNIQFGFGLLTPFGPLFTQRMRVPLLKYLHVGLSHQATAILIDPFSGIFLAGDARAILTYGTHDRFLNFGLGKAYSTLDNEPAINTISLAGGGKVGNNWHVYGELAYYEGNFDDTILPSFTAARGEGRHRWRFGLGTLVIPDVVTLPLPFVGYDYHW